jgi:hypothetical protein
MISAEAAKSINEEIDLSIYLFMDLFAKQVNLVVPDSRLSLVEMSCLPPSNRSIYRSINRSM